MKGASSDKKRKAGVLAEIDSDMARDILQRLAGEDADLRKKIERAALEMLRGIDPEAVASELIFALNSLRAEDVWDHSGRTRDGYVDPTDCAFGMFEGELEPFLEDMRKYRRLAMRAEARAFCEGILQGLYMFGEGGESDTEFAEWAVDAPREFFDCVLDEWVEKCRFPKDVEAVNAFARLKCPEWWNAREKREAMRAGRGRTKR